MIINNDSYTKNRNKELIQQYEVKRPNQMPSSAQKLKEVLGYYRFHLKQSKKM